MPSLSRSGVTLAELLVALTLTAVIAAGTLGLVWRVQDLYRAESLSIERNRSLRIAAALLPAELRELDAADGDLVAMGPDALTIRAPRQLAVLCRAPRFEVPPIRATLTVRDAPRYGLRDFNPRTDSLWVYYEGDAATRDDDGWIQASLDSVTADVCPDGRAASRVSAALRPSPGQRLGRGTIPAGAPVLGFETVTYRLYRSSSDRRWYVGLATGGNVQPLLGPVTSAGLHFTFLDATGAPTTEPARVALIELRIRAATVEPIRTASGRLDSPSDSVVAVVALRNGPRF